MVVRWVAHPLFAPVLVLAIFGLGAGTVALLLLGPQLAGWSAPWIDTLLTRCFGWDAELRRYRLDRILELQPTTSTHECADPVDAPAFDTEGADQVRVQYSQQVARWIAERENAQCERDGTLVLTHDVVDMNWLVRHVLQYGGEAVVQTPGARPLIERAARQLLEE